LLEEAGAHGVRFAHDLIREVVEGDVSAARRNLLHRRLGEALAALPGTPRVVEIAYHYAYSAEHARAALWLERAGDEAVAELANAAAAEHYKAALEHLGLSDAAPAQCAGLDEKLGDLRLMLGQYAQAQEHFARARALTVDPAARAELWRKEGETWEKRGEYARALAAFDAAEEGTASCTEMALPASVRAALEISRAEVYWKLSQLDAQEAAATRARALLERESPGRARDLVQARADYQLGNAACERGEWARADAFLRRSLAIHERVRDLHGAASCLYRLGYAMYHLNPDVRQAEAEIRRSLALFEQIGEQHGIARCWHELGNLCFARPDLLGAGECYRRSLAIQEQIGDQEGVDSSWIGLAAVAWEGGDYAGAETCYTSALVLAEHIELPWGVQISCMMLAELAMGRGDLTRTEAYCRRGLATKGDTFCEVPSGRR
jgi:tetratricopeptide (TPR) repeat protein